MRLPLNLLEFVKVNPHNSACVIIKGGTVCSTPWGTRTSIDSNHKGLIEIAAPDCALMSR